MSNNKQIEKPLELPHQETIVGTNTLQTKPFDNQKINMSNNKQSSIELLFQDMFELTTAIIPEGQTRYELMKNAFEQAKAMHKSEIIWAHGIKMKGVNNHKCVSGEQYYNETFGGNNEQQ